MLGKLRTGHIVEFAFWLVFAGLAWYFSYDFNQRIEIYEFGASGWPRAVILLMVAAALGQLYWHWRLGDETPHDTIGNAGHADDAPVAEDADHPLVHYMRVGPILALPFIFAYFLEDIGFYTLAPIFIILVILLMGGRNPLKIIGVTALVYGLLLFLFTKVLYVGLPTGNVHPFYDFSNWLIPVIQTTQILEFIGLVFVLPALFAALVSLKGENDARAIATKAALVWLVFVVLGTGAGWLLGGRAHMFDVLKVLIYPLTALAG